MSRQDEIEAALRALTILPDKEQKLQNILNILSNDGFLGQGKVPPKFILVNEKTTFAELQKLNKLATKLATHINQIHLPAIVEMYDWDERTILPNQLLEMAEKAKQAASRVEQKLKMNAIESVTSSGGKPTNYRSKILASLLATAYYELTNKVPSVATNAYADTNAAYGPFFVLVKSVFKAFDLHDNAEHFARQACNNFKEEST